MDTAFLVRLSISQFNPRRLDRSATKEARERAGAGDQAGVKVYKSIVAAEALDAIEAIANEARAEHRKRTVPWQYDGPGAIAAAGFQGYKKKMQELEAAFYRAVDRFVTCYADEREAAKAYLGSLYNASDYPDDVRGKFSFSVIAEPMPQSSDFRIAGLSQTDADAIARDLDKRRAAALESANKTAWDRIADTVRKLQTKVRDYKPAEGDGKASGVFRDSLVDNLREIVAMIPSLNVTNDKELESIAATVDTELCGYTASNLRDSADVRADVVESAADILAKVQSIWAARGGADTQAATEENEAA